MSADDTGWHECSKTTAAPPGKFRVMLMDLADGGWAERDFASLDEAIRATKEKLRGGIWTNASIFDDHGTCIEELEASSGDLN